MKETDKLQQYILDAQSYIAKKYGIAINKLKLDSICERDTKVYINLSWRPLLRKEKFIVWIDTKDNFITGASDMRD